MSDLRFPTLKRKEIKKRIDLIKSCLHGHDQVAEVLRKGSETFYLCLVKNIYICFIHSHIIFAALV
jgi:hypothetical protein